MMKTPGNNGRWIPERSDARRPAAVRLFVPPLSDFKPQGAFDFTLPDKPMPVLRAEVRNIDRRHRIGRQHDNPGASV